MIGDTKKTILKICHQYIFFLIIAGFLMAFTYESDSQTMYCYPDCDSSLWQPVPPNLPYTHIIVLPCGQPVIVFYRTRHACNEWWDLFIERIHFANGNEGAAACGLTMTLQQMVNNAIEQLIVQNPMRFPPLNPQKDTCVEKYRVMLSPCWRANFPIAASGPPMISGSVESRVEGSVSLESAAASSSNPGMLEPCGLIDCCLQAYTICYVNGQKIITYKPEESQSGHCNPGGFPDCKPVCQ